MEHQIILEQGSPPFVDEAPYPEFPITMKKYSLRQSY